MKRFTIEDGCYKDNERGVKSGNSNTTLAWLNELATGLKIVTKQRNSREEELWKLNEEINLLRNELDLVREQGYTLSDAYRRYIGDRELEYDYWIKKQVERGRSL